MGRKAWSWVKYRLPVMRGQVKTAPAGPEPHREVPPSGRSRGTPQDPSCCRSTIAVAPDLCPRPVAICDHEGVHRPDPADLFRYLNRRENHIDDIRRTNDILRMPRVLLEIGCGSGEAARLIARENPEMGVIATDLYDFTCEPANGSYYGKIARQWCARELPSQKEVPPNLVVLRAEADLLRCLPDAVLDTILLINPEPLVGKAFIQFLQEEGVAAKIKPGPNQIVILPYSRELGVMACGGCSFEHDPDWSRGLGYILGSGLAFRRGLPVQWGIDLPRVSAYSGNSTQRDIFIYGDTPN